MFGPLLSGVPWLSPALIMQAFVRQSIAPLSQAFQQHLICYRPLSSWKRTLLDTWVCYVLKCRMTWSSRGFLTTLVDPWKHVPHLIMIPRHVPHKATATASPHNQLTHYTVAFWKGTVISFADRSFKKYMLFSTSFQGIVPFEENFWLIQSVTNPWPQTA